MTVIKAHTQSIDLLIKSYNIRGIKESIHNLHDEIPLTIKQLRYSKAKSYNSFVRQNQEFYPPKP